MKGTRMTTAILDKGSLPGVQTTVNCFEIPDGDSNLVFYGLLDEAKDEYRRLNPSKKWIIWLIDNYKQLDN